MWLYRCGHSALSPMAEAQRYDVGQDFLVGHGDRQSFYVFKYRHEQTQRWDADESDEWIILRQESQAAISQQHMENQLCEVRRTKGGHLAWDSLAVTQNFRDVDFRCTTGVVYVAEITRTGMVVMGDMVRMGDMVQPDLHFAKAHRLMWSNVRLHCCVMYI